MSSANNLTEFIEESKSRFQRVDVSVYHYMNARTHDLLLLQVDISSEYRKPKDLTKIAVELTPLSGRKILEGAEAFISTDNRLGINVEKLNRKR